MKKIDLVVLGLVFLSGCATVPPECKRYTDNWDTVSKEEKMSMRYNTHCYRYLSSKEKEDRQKILTKYHSSLIDAKRARYDEFIAGLSKGQALESIKAKLKPLEEDNIIIVAQKDPTEKEPGVTKVFGRSRFAVKGFALIFSEGKLASWEENNY